jgi:uncharacterized membrane protein
MMGYGWNGMGWGSWAPWGGPGLIGLGVSAVLWIGILATLVAGTVWLTRQLGRQPRLAEAEDMPLSQVRRRLASGEITADEYDESVHRLQVRVRSPD